MCISLKIKVLQKLATMGGRVLMIYNRMDRWANRPMDLRHYSMQAQIKRI